jgi:phosphoadenosine phosphosulfate reductase
MKNNVLQLDLAKANKFLKELEPIEIIEWMMNLSDNPMLTTNFGPYSASLIHAVNRVNKDISIVWCDTGYNTSQTYNYAHHLIDRFSLNIHIYRGSKT